MSPSIFRSGTTSFKLLEDHFKWLQKCPSSLCRRSRDDGPVVFSLGRGSVRDQEYKVYKSSLSVERGRRPYDYKTHLFFLQRWWTRSEGTPALVGFYEVFLTDVHGSTVRGYPLHVRHWRPTRSLSSSGEEVQESTIDHNKLTTSSWDPSGRDIDTETTFSTSVRDGYLSFKTLYLFGGKTI